jgi:hypothetical protein
MQYPSIVEAKHVLPANQMQYYRTQKHVNPILQDLAPMQYYRTQKHVYPILQDLAPILHVHDRDLFLQTTPQQPAWGASSFFNFLHYCEKKQMKLI